MDLPTCPACGQSVLDDDVEDCPFCGASMSGKPAKKAPAKPSSKKPETPTAKPPAPSKAASKPTIAKVQAEPEDDDDNPITADKDAAKRAVPLARKPAKGRMHRVVCPMCETAGFTSIKAAGKEVRCSNPECLVPLFTAPPLEVEEKRPEKPVVEKSGIPTGMLIGAGVVVLVAVAGWAYTAFLVPDIEQIKGPTAEELAFLLQDDQKKDEQPKSGTRNNGTGKEGTEPKKDPSTTNGPPQLTPAEIRKRALKEIVIASRRQAENRSKPFCRRLSAEAYVAAGDIKGARTQLVQLTKVGSGLPYFHVTPLVMIAWKQLKDGDSDTAAATTEQAWSAAKRLQNVGRFALDASTELAALLIVVGRENDARDLIQDHQDPGPVGQLSAMLTAAEVLKTFDLEREATQKPLLDWTAPQRVAVTVSLAVRGYEDKALAWAKASSDIQSQAECLSAWAEILAKSTSQPEKLATIAEQIASSTPVVKARIFARVAFAQLNVGNQSGATQSLVKAKTALKAIEPAKEIALPGLKELSQELPAKPSNPIPMQMAALAAGEVARVEAGLKKKSEAWDSLTLALKFAKGIGPSLAVVQRHLDDIDRKGASTVRNEIKTALELDNDDKTRLAFNRYRRQLGLFRGVADHRLRLQVSILKQAAGWDLLDEVAEEVRSREKEADENRREPFFSTSLPLVLAARYRTAGEDDQAKALESAVSETAASDRHDAIEQSTLQLIADGKIKEAAAEIEALKADRPGDREWQLEWLLRLACRLVDSGQVEQGLDFASRFRSQVWHEDAYRLIAALSARKNRGTTAIMFVKQGDLTPTEQVALYRGLVAGTVAFEAEAKSRPTTTTPDSTAKEEKTKASTVDK